MNGIEPVDGGWTSGGGELIKDKHNPWFLNNIQRIYYCIEIDQDNFSLNEKLVRLRVSQAIDFWKKEFEKTDSLSNIKIATQDFIEQVSCNHQTDLSFQFGYLSPKQLSKVSNHNQHVAFSVRTEYDSIHLKGKGFIYLSADSGPLALDIEHDIEGMWSQGQGYMAQWILVHELGHVFGIPHDPSSILMSATFAEDLVMGYVTDNIVVQGSIPYSYFQYNIQNGLDFSECYDEYEIPNLKKSPAFDFFNPPDRGGKSCYGIEISENHELNVYTKSFFSKWSNDKIKIGSAQLTLFESSFAPETYGLISVYLPDNQIVFGSKDLKKSFNSRVQLYERSELNFQGIYRSVDGSTKRQIFVKLRANTGPIFSGIVNGILFPDLMYDHR